MNLGFAVLEQLDYLILASAQYHPSIHPPNFSAYPIQGHGGPVIEQEPVYTLGRSPVCHMANA